VIGPDDLDTLEPDRCQALLAEAPWARIAFVVDGAPEVLPVHVIVLDGDVFFRTAPGAKLATAAASGPVAVEADGGEPASRTAWSVVAHGEASIVTDGDLEARLLALPLDPLVLPSGPRFWVRVAVSAWTGRRLGPDRPTPRS
jgi:nitroimidazol reductase NimA-like FMN-containing flavoprotein (pyridoxamine 5'-phosphate oxidase superfamily)